MAILHNIEASILVNGQRLPEYDNPDVNHQTQAANVIHQYVEATPNEFEFEIKFNEGFQFPPDCTNVASQSFIDGKRGSTCLMNHIEFYRKGWVVVKDRGLILGHGPSAILQPYNFGQMRTSDEDPDRSKLGSYAHLGTIRIVIWPITALEHIPDPTMFDQPRIESSDNIPEKILKGKPIDLRAGFSPAKPDPERASSKVRCRYGNSPMATFIYDYRSRRALQMLDIIHDPNVTLPFYARFPTVQSVDPWFSRVDTTNASFIPGSDSHEISILKRETPAEDDVIEVEYKESKRVKVESRKRIVVDLTNLD